MTVALLASVGIGLGLVGTGAGLHRAGPSLQANLAKLDRPPAPSGWWKGPGRCRGAVLRPDVNAGAALASAADRRPWVTAKLAPALALTSSDMGEVCRQVALAAGVGALLPPLMWVVMEAGGVKLPWMLPVWASLVGAMGGAFLPLGVLRAGAARARRRARIVVGAYLDLVVLCLAGGMGIEGALHAAATIGETDISRRLVAALERARNSGVTPWRALADLGAEVDLTELVELSAAVGLAGTEGAKIRATLAAKAASIRRHELADAETEANTVTERLFLPGVVLLVGFLLFVGYPAFARIADGF